MNTRLFIGLLALSVAACGDPAKDELSNAVINPEAYLTSNEQEDFLYSISRYICKYPSQAGRDNMWNERFDSAYAKLAKAQQLRHYYIDSVSGTHHFMVSRIAPSIHEKYVGLAGKFSPSEDDPLAEYEEVFRTWKMFPAEHKEKSEMLFHKWIKGDDLSLYYTANSGGVEYIEFPDEETWYDKDARQWQTRRGDVLQPYRQLKEKEE